MSDPERAEVLAQLRQLAEDTLAVYAPVIATDTELTPDQAAAIKLAHGYLYICDALLRAEAALKEYEAVVEAAKELVDKAPRCKHCGHLHIEVPDGTNTGSLTWRNCSVVGCAPHPLFRAPEERLGATLKRLDQ